MPNFLVFRNKHRTNPVTREINTFDDVYDYIDDIEQVKEVNDPYLVAVFNVRSAQDAKYLWEHDKQVFDTKYLRNNGDNEKNRTYLKNIIVDGFKLDFLKE